MLFAMVDKGLSGSCRFFQDCWVGYRNIREAFVESEGRTRDSITRGLPENDLLAPSTAKCTLRHVGLSHVEEVSSSCSVDVPILQPWTVTYKSGEAGNGRVKPWLQG